METVKVTVVRKNKRLVRVVVEDLQDEKGVDIEALVIMECIRPHVSTTIFDMLMMQLSAFTNEMQVEVADNLLDFVNEGIMKYTGCSRADFVLDACYKWIGEEQEQEDDYEED